MYIKAWICILQGHQAAATIQKGMKSVIDLCLNVCDCLARLLYEISYCLMLEGTRMAQAPLHFQAQDKRHYTTYAPEIEATWYDAVISACIDQDVCFVSHCETGQVVHVG